MDDIIVWIIIAAFYAPLHYLLPVLFLFVTGQEDDETRKALIKRALIDSTVSMAVVFTLIIWLAKEHLSLAMAIMAISLAFPFVRIWTHRREITSVQSER